MTERKRRSRAALAEAVKRILDAAPSAPHRIEDIAAEFGVSPFHLSRVFRAETGESVHQYLLRVRMQQALSRLPDEAHLSRLALDLGFSSHSHFSEAFRRHFGESPTQVRAALRSRLSVFDSGRPGAVGNLCHTSTSGSVKSTTRSLENQATLLPTARRA